MNSKELLEGKNDIFLDFCINFCINLRIRRVFKGNLICVIDSIYLLYAVYNCNVYNLYKIVYCKNIHFYCSFHFLKHFAICTKCNNKSHYIILKIIKNYIHIRGRLGKKSQKIDDVFCEYICFSWERVAHNSWLYLDM